MTFRLFTGWWFGKYPDDHVKVGISRGTPRGMTPGYKRYPKLNPGSWFNSVSPAEYLSLYNTEVLAPLDPQQVVNDIMKLAGDRIPVLVCYESPKDIQAGTKWCHRHIAAVWLEDSLGIEVREVGQRDLDRFHLLRKVGVTPPSYATATGRPLKQQPDLLDDILGREIRDRSQRSARI
jgi:hypothetical protein